MTTTSLSERVLAHETDDYRIDTVQVDDQGKKGELLTVYAVINKHTGIVEARTDSLSVVLAKLHEAQGNLETFVKHLIDKPPAGNDSEVPRLN